jgi:hypothetical protein
MQAPKVHGSNDCFKGKRHFLAVVPFEKLSAISVAHLDSNFEVSNGRFHLTFVEDSKLDAAPSQQVTVSSR